MTNELLFNKGPNFDAIKLFLAERFSPHDYIEQYLGIGALKRDRMSFVVNNFSELTKKGLKAQKEFEPGPLILRTDIAPPETNPKILEGKQAIGIDIGGTNLRIGVGKIENGKIKPQSEIKPVEIKTQYKNLDDFFQMLLDNGLEKILKDNPDIPIACIFSFPGIGKSDGDGVDMILGKNMTKGWKIGNSAGKSLGFEFNKFLVKKDELMKKNKKIKDSQKKYFGKRGYFIANDTVALIKNGETDAGIVCASGYNWSFVIRKNLLGENASALDSEKTIINSESGSTNSSNKEEPLPAISVLLREYLANIEQVEAKDLPIRDEYQISGKYLGRTLGLAVKQLKRVFNLFPHAENTDFDKSFIVSQILKGKWSEVKKGFNSSNDFSDIEKDLLVQIATGLRDRSAQIVAGHFVGLCEAGVFGDKKDFIIASDGPIIQNMPGWKERFFEEITSLSENRIHLTFKETEYSNQERDFRGIFDVMYQAIEYFQRKKYLF